MTYVLIIENFGAYEFDGVRTFSTLPAAVTTAGKLLARLVTEHASVARETFRYETELVSDPRRAALHINEIAEHEDPCDAPFRATIYIYECADDGSCGRLVWPTKTP